MHPVHIHAMDATSLVQTTVHNGPCQHSYTFVICLWSPMSSSNNMLYHAYAYQPRSALLRHIAICMAIFEIIGFLQLPHLLVGCTCTSH